MIKLADSTIMINTPSGETTPFEPEQIQAGIVHSFDAAGIHESWLAEDITMAVEFALSQNFSENKLFSSSEINSTIIKILEVNGFPDAAEHYRKYHAFTEITLSPDPAALSTLLERQLALHDDTLKKTVGKVCEAARRLGINYAPPSLFVEMARYFKNTTAPLPEKDMLAGKTATPLRMNNSSLGKNRYLVPAAEINAQLSPATKQFIETGIVSVKGISAISNSLLLELRLAKLASYLNFKPVITEMMMLTRFNETATILNECFDCASKLMAKAQPTLELHASLSVPDMSTFAIKYLGAEWPEAKKDCRYFLTCLINSLNFNIFSVRMS